MKFIDFHCDTLYRVLHKEYKERTDTLADNSGHIDLSRLHESGTIAQCFACFVNTKNAPITSSHYNDVHKMIGILEEGIVNDSRYILNSSPISQGFNNLNSQKNRTLAILTLEEGGVIEGKLSRVEELYDRGIRMITLTWNYENCIGYPNAGYKYQNKGLKPFGIDLIRKMDELGMVIDVSHLSDGGFYDVVKYGTRPFVASHSNARSVMNHPRNLTDDMIIKIKDAGGIIGLNYYGAFLQENGICTFEVMCKHIEHIIGVGGEAIVCLGSDFDGIECELPMKGCEELYLFAEFMKKYGFTDELIKKVCYKNAIEFWKRYDKNS